MKIGVISDTHDQVHLIRKSVQLLNEQNIDLLVHCGDWVSPFSLRFYSELKAPIRGVFGNNDGDKLTHLTVRDQLQLDLQIHEKLLILELENRRLAVTHGDFPGIVKSLVTSGEYDAVFHGHTHRKVNDTQGKTLSLNPGSLMTETSSEVKGASLAIYDILTNTANHILI